MSYPRGYPAYFHRYQVAYVAWFCNQGDAEAFLRVGDDLGNLWPIGHEPNPGDEPEPRAEYEDLGHDHCLAADCPEGEETEQCP